MILKIRLWASQRVRQPINLISPAVLEVEETSKMGKRINEVRPISQILTLLLIWLSSKAKGIKKEGESHIFLKLRKLKFYCDGKKKSSVLWPSCKRTPSICQLQTINIICYYSVLLNVFVHPLPAPAVKELFFSYAIKAHHYASMVAECSSILQWSFNSLNKTPNLQLLIVNDWNIFLYLSVAANQSLWNQKFIAEHSIVHYGKCSTTSKAYIIGLIWLYFLSVFFFPLLDSGMSCIQVHISYLYSLEL